MRFGFAAVALAACALFAPFADAQDDNILLVLFTDDRFTSLVSGLIATGLLDTLDGPGPFTVFAPTNEAFESASIPDNADVTDILSYHIAGEAVEFEDGKVVTMLNGDTIVLTGPPFQINGEANIEDVILASNGIIYVVDDVLIPGDSTPSSPTPGTVTPPPAPSTPPELPDECICDLCPDGIVDPDPDKLVGFSAPFIGVVQATCLEWAVGVCTQVEALGDFADLVCEAARDTLAGECCLGAETAPTSSPLPPATVSPTPGATTPPPTPSLLTIAPTIPQSPPPITISPTPGAATPPPTPSLLTIAPTIPPSPAPITISPTPGAATPPPTPSPTTTPTASPTSGPTEMPTGSPTGTPTSAPTSSPTAPPSPAPIAPVTPTPGTATTPTTPGTECLCEICPDNGNVVVDPEKFVAVSTTVGVFETNCGMWSELLCTDFEGLEGDFETCDFYQAALIELCCLEMAPAPTPGTATEAPAPPGTPSLELLTPVDYAGCMKVNGAAVDDASLFLATCSDTDPSQKFSFDGEYLHPGGDTTKCLQAGRTGNPMDGNKLRVFACDPTNAAQQFTWDGENGAPLKLANFDEFCVVFRGIVAHSDIDPIIVKKCADVEFMRRGWIYNP